MWGGEFKQETLLPKLKLCPPCVCFCRSSWRCWQWQRPYASFSAWGFLDNARITMLKLLPWEMKPMATHCQGSWEPRSRQRGFLTSALVPSTLPSRRKSSAVAFGSSLFWFFLLWALPPCSHWNSCCWILHQIAHRRTYSTAPVSVTSSLVSAPPLLWNLGIYFTLSGSQLHIYKGNFLCVMFYW